MKFKHEMCKFICVTFNQHFLFIVFTPLFCYTKTSLPTRSILLHSR
jgi:hypothetical protein